MAKKSPKEKRAAEPKAAADWSLAKVDFEKWRSIDIEDTKYAGHDGLVKMLVEVGMPEAVSFLKA